MKTILKFVVASFVSLFIMIGALGTSGYKSVFLIGLAFAVWVLFVRSVNVRPNRNRRDFEEFMKYKKKGY